MKTKIVYKYLNYVTKDDFDEVKSDFKFNIAVLRLEMAKKVDFKEIMQKLTSCLLR